MTTHVLAFAVCHSGCSTHYCKHFDWANPGSMVNQCDKARTGKKFISWSTQSSFMYLQPVTEPYLTCTSLLPEVTATGLIINCGYQDCALAKPQRLLMPSFCFWVTR